MQAEDLNKPGCVRTFSGVYFNLTKPDAKDVFVMDIAVALARECRFNNATKKMYSVAEHSVWCALKAEEKYPDNKRLPFYCLLHDAHEYIWRDLPSPIKKLIPDYEFLQEITQAAIHMRYNVYVDINDRRLIKEIDQIALNDEWENKVLTHTGLVMDEPGRIGYFLHHFKRLCQVPYVLVP